MRHLEKRDHLLERLGANLRGQREAVFQEDMAQFAQRLALFGATEATQEIVQAMEAGDPAISIGLWMCAWQAMQVADRVAAATKSEAALFLAAARHAPGIEAQMSGELNKRKAPP